MMNHGRALRVSTKKGDVRAMEKNQGQELERLTVLLDHSAIKSIKHLAVDRGVSTSQIVRSAVGDFLKASDGTEAPKTNERSSAV